MEVADTEQKYGHFIEALIRQKSERYLQTLGVDGMDRPGYRAYLREAKRLLMPAGPVCLLGLMLEGKIIATSWGYLADRKFYCIMFGFDGGASGALIRWAA